METGTERVSDLPQGRGEANERTEIWTLLFWLLISTHSSSPTYFFFVFALFTALSRCVCMFVGVMCLRTKEVLIPGLELSLLVSHFPPPQYTCTRTHTLMSHERPVMNYIVLRPLKIYLEFYVCCCFLYNGKSARVPSRWQLIGQ